MKHSRHRQGKGKQTPDRSGHISSAGSRWPHRIAWALAAAIFPLIWMGGLVTTFGAGMAVPDWPGTYGHNLFLYPVTRWLPLWPTALWDVFLEHSHRLLGSLAGFLAIALVVGVWRSDCRRPVRWLSVAMLTAVAAQGVLGGLRVLGDDLLLAKIHGCTAPLVFALAAGMVIVTSPAWTTPTATGAHAATRPSAWLSPATGGAIYLQIVLGAQLRHLAPDSGPGWFALWVWLHLAGAALVAVFASVLLVHCKRFLQDEPALSRRAVLLAGLVAVQLVAGVFTWVTNYGWPRWVTDYFWSIQYTVTAESPEQVLATTGHMALGSLCLAASLSLACWGFRGAGQLSQSDWLATAADYWQLARPGILAMVLLAMLVAMLTVGPAVPPVPVVLNALVGAALVVAGALAMNQLVESPSDARMVRTCLRPLATGRISRRRAAVFGVTASLGGMLYLALTVNTAMVLAAVVSWVVYVWVYTPLKLITPWQTPVGAIAGAMPVVLGAAAAWQPFGWLGWNLFAIVYFWQFPHAMAIAWLYRDQFAGAGIRLAGITDPSGRLVGTIALVGAAILLPVALVPLVLQACEPAYALVAAVVCLGYLLCAVWFRWSPSAATARWMLRYSLVCLLALLLAWLLGVRAAR